MISSRICLVLGAGASVPLGFPSAEQLKDAVGRDSASVRDLLVECGFDRAEQEKFRLELLTSRQPSVDAFLELRPEYLRIGKAAIAATLIPSEFAARFHLPQKGEWYDYLFRQMQPKSLEDLSKIPLSIVTFNYDRSIEYFLMTALRNSLGANEDETAQALAEIPIVHVYGQLGRPHFWDPDGREYNPNRTSAIIQKCADHVTILREQDRTTPEFEKAQTLILQAALVCFLGFGYHPVNLERLNLPLTLSKQSVLGTAFGLARDERRRVRGQFGQCRRTVRLTLGNEDEDALEFLRAYPVFD